MKNLPQSEVVTGHADYDDLILLQDEILNRVSPRDLGLCFAALVRDAIDFVLDPVRTARTKLTDLDNVEKTFIGLKLEHLVREMLDAPKGVRDLRLCDRDVDIKNTVDKNWSIPKETYDASEACLLMAQDEDKNTCFLGLFVAKPAYLHPGKGNRDKKKGINAKDYRHILWMLKDQPFPRSKFFDLDMHRFRVLRKEFSFGNARAAQFFRENSYTVVHREVIHALLFDQYDYMKRLRANGGAPDVLRKEGAAILIGTYEIDRKVASDLGVTLARDEVVGVTARTKAERKVLKTAKLID
jgi:hypothetical protein